MLSLINTVLSAKQRACRKTLCFSQNTVPFVKYRNEIRIAEKEKVHTDFGIQS